MEAYAWLSRCKQPGESFSEVIQRVVRPPLNVKAWLRRVRENSLSPEAIKAVEAQIANRRGPG